MKNKKVYFLRVRENDDKHWSEPSCYKSKKNRNQTAAVNRTIGGLRTYSYEEVKNAEEIEKIEFED